MPSDRGLIDRSSPIARSARIMQLEGMFDLKPADEDHVRIAALPVDELAGHDWSIGLVVGPSGSGKSTVAREAFGSLVDPELAWPTAEAVVDSFPPAMSMRDVSELLSSVGFSSPPAWRRPYHVLSNGEQFRVRMARLLAEHADDVLVVDEFTSVVDRTVAQIGSAAIARTVRRRGQRFVAVTCHYDVEEWLQPDWVYQPHVGEITWRSLQPRPPIALDVIRATMDAWRVFAPHHYLSADINRSARMLVGLVDDRPAALIGVIGFPHRAYPQAVRLSRVVVLPDYQGVGLAFGFMVKVAAAYEARGKAVFITSSHPAVVRSLNRSPLWAMNTPPRRMAKDTGRNLTAMGRSRASARLVAGFRYAGPPDPDLLPLVT